MSITISCFFHFFCFITRIQQIAKNHSNHPPIRQHRFFGLCFQNPLKFFSLSLPLMQYSFDSFWTARAIELARALEFSHISLERLKVFKSKGSKSRRTIARIHSLPKILQLGLEMNAFYAIELISERFDRLSEEDKTKTLIHELLHIPHSFKGGFRHHQLVSTKRVQELYKKLQNPEQP